MPGGVSQYKIDVVVLERNALIQLAKVQRSLNSLATRSRLIGANVRSNLSTPIVATAKSVDVLTSKMNGLRVATASASKVFVNAFGLLGVGFAVRSVVELADSYQFIENRIRVVAESTSQVNVLMKELFEASVRARAGFKQLAEVYARTALSANNLGTSQRELLQFAESVNKAVFISGSTPRESNAALIQLSQGLASNTLRGDELRAVQEQIPYVAEIIARSIGITRGELRELGAQGAISADLVLKAFREFRIEIRDKFNSTVLTVSQSLAILRSTFTVMLGELNKTSQILPKIAQAFLFLSDNMEYAFRIVGVLVSELLLLLGLKVGKYLINTTTTFSKFFLTLSKNSKYVLGLVAILKLLAASIYVFREIEVFRTLGDTIITARDIFASLYAILKNEIVQILDELGVSGSTVRDILILLVRYSLKSFVAALLALSDVLIVTVRLVKNLIIAAKNLIKLFLRGSLEIYATLEILSSNVIFAFSAFFELLGKIADNTISIIREKFLGLFDSILGLFEVIVTLGGNVDTVVDNKIKDARRNIQERLENVRPRVEIDFSASREALEGRNTALTDFYNRSVESLELSQHRETVGDIFRNLPSVQALGRAGDIALEKRIQAREDAIANQYDGLAREGNRTAPVPLTRLEKEIKRLDDETKAYMLNTDVREVSIATNKAEIRIRKELTEAQREQYGVAFIANREAKRRASILDSLIKPELDYASTVKVLNELLDEGTITQFQFNKVQEANLLPLQAKIRGLTNENTLLMLNTQERKLANAIAQVETQTKTRLNEVERYNLTLAVQLNNSYSKRASILEELKGPQLDFLETQRALNILLAQGTITITQYNEKLIEARLAALDTQDTYIAGVERAFLRIKQDYTNFSSVVEDTIVNAFQRSTDALEEFVTSGKFGFRDLVNSILKDLARLAVRRAITQPLFNTIGGFFTAGPATISPPTGPQNAGVSGPGPQLGTHSKLDFGNFRLADGGYVRGPGGPRSDSILKAVSAGEYVMNAASTSLFLPLLDIMNGIRQPRGKPSSTYSGNQGSVPNSVNINQNSSPVTVEIYDQRVSSDDQPPVGVGQGIDADGKQVVQVLIRDTVKDGIERGDFDSRLGQRFQIKPVGNYKQRG